MLPVPYIMGLVPAPNTARPSRPTNGSRHRPPSSHFLRTYKPGRGRPKKRDCGHGGIGCDGEDFRPAARQRLPQREENAGKEGGGVFAWVAKPLRKKRVAIPWRQAFEGTKEAARSYMASAKDRLRCAASGVVATWRPSHGANPQPNKKTPDEVSFPFKCEFATAYQCPALCRVVESVLTDNARVEFPAEGSEHAHHDHTRHAGKQLDPMNRREITSLAEGMSPGVMRAHFNARRARKRRRLNSADPVIIPEVRMAPLLTLFTLTSHLAMGLLLNLSVHG